MFETVEVVRHAGQKHIDDVLGVALIVGDDPTVEVQVVEVAPQDGAAIDAARARGAVFVDVGGSYDPVRGQYDHHQDPALPCAAVLVARSLGYAAFLGSPAAVFMTVKDLRGFAAAVKETGHKPGPEAAAAESNLVSVKLTREMASCIVGVIATMHGGESYEELIIALWNAAPASAKAEAEAAAKAKAEAEAKALAAAHVVEVDGVRVVMGTMAVPAPVAFKAFPGAAIVVCPNAMRAEHVSITKDTSHALASGIDLTKASEACGLPQVFLHNSGFIAVLEGQVDGLDVPALVRGVRLTS